jgi:membrane protein YqaA with SNARE-associated domain
LELILEYGLFGLFLACFLAATLLPFSSELAVIGAVSMGFDKTDVLIWASLGNVLACIANYALGYYFRKATLPRIKSSNWGNRALLFWEKYGFWSLLLNWLPLIGDPITVAAGLGRFNFVYFLVFVILLRVGRYLFILQFI